MSGVVVDRRTVNVWDNKIRMQVQVSGSGPPLLYLHPAGGLQWDRFLSEISHTHTIYAPVFPGTDPADSFAIHHLDDIFDVVLAYEQAVRALDIVDAPVIGQSFGGMLAAELASSFPNLFSRIVLLDPAGLWNTTNPWNLDFMWAPPEQLPKLLFSDPMHEEALKMFAPPSSPEAGIETAVAAIWTFGCVAKFLWPIPDRGLSRRLHRICKPALILWGEEDQLIPVAYAREFGRRIANSRVEIFPNCGHIPQVEQMEKTLSLVQSFLA